MQIPDRQVERLRSKLDQLHEEFGSFQSKVILITITEDDLHGEDPSKTEETVSLECWMRHPGRADDTSTSAIVQSIGKVAQVRYILLFTKDYLRGKDLVSVDGQILIKPMIDLFEIYSKRYEIFAINQDGMIKGNQTLVRVFVGLSV